MQLGVLCKSCAARLRRETISRCVASVFCISDEPEGRVESSIYDLDYTGLDVVHLMQISGKAVVFAGEQPRH